MTDKPTWLPTIDVEAVLAVGSILVFGAALAVVLFKIVPAPNEKYVMLMLGALIGVVKDTFGRYFQATKGSQEQRQDFANLATAAADSVNEIAKSAPAVAASVVAAATATEAGRDT